MRSRIVAIVIAIAFSVAVPLVGHHAFSSEFDGNKPVKVKGVISRIEWINPHTWIHVDVKDADGKITKWMIEGGSPNALIRRGVTSQLLKVGMEVMVDGYQAKDGTNRAVGKDLTFKDGKRLFLGGSAPGANGESK